MPRAPNGKAVYAEARRIFESTMVHSELARAAGVEEA
jgi:hypothetical protein